MAIAHFLIDASLFGPGDFVLLFHSVAFLFPLKGPGIFPRPFCFQLHGACQTIRIHQRSGL